MIRVLVDSEESAELIAARLRGDGFEATIGRQAFAGEDDDEDHAWVLTTDAPPVMVELIADDHDGWVEYDDPHPGPAPIDLPGMPKRHHRPVD